jgi:hypothetical protein
LKVMIELMPVPETMLGFRASGDVTREDYQGIVVPEVCRLIRERKDLNFLLLLEPPLSTTMGASWVREVCVNGVGKLTAWNRVAIVSDSEAVKSFARAFRVFARGELRSFMKAELNTAVSWTAGGDWAI